MLTQLERLESALLSGRKMTQWDMIQELGIGNHTGRISELRQMGYTVNVEKAKTQQGWTGLYSIGLDERRPENVPGKGDAFEYPV